MNSPTSDSPLLAGFTHQYVPSTPGPFAGTVLLLLHGTGGDETSLLELGRSLASGAALLSPRGQVLEHGSARRFFRRLAEGVFDEADLRVRAAALAAFVEAAAAEYRLNGRRVIALGFSNGANLAAATLLLHPGTLSGAVLLRAMVPLETSASTSLDAIPVILCSGRFDPLVPVQNAERLAEMLRVRGAKVTHHWQENGHDLSAGDFAAVQGWFRSL